MIAGQMYDQRRELIGSYENEAQFVDVMLDYCDPDHNLRTTEKELGDGNVYFFMTALSGDRKDTEAFLTNPELSDLYQNGPTKLYPTLDVALVSEEKDRQIAIAGERNVFVVEINIDQKDVTSLYLAKTKEKAADTAGRRFKGYKAWSGE